MDKDYAVEIFEMFLEDCEDKEDAKESFELSTSMDFEIWFKNKIHSEAEARPGKNPLYPLIHEFIKKSLEAVEYFEQ